MLLCLRLGGDFRATAAVNSLADRTGARGLPDRSQVALLRADRDLFDDRVSRGGQIAAATQSQVAKEGIAVGLTAGHQNQQP
jgi:hypothetical protein